MSCDMPQPEFGVLQGTSFHECATAGMIFTPIMILCFNFLWHFNKDTMVKWPNV